MHAGVKMKNKCARRVHLCVLKRVPLGQQENEGGCRASVRENELKISFF